MNLLLLVWGWHMWVGGHKLPQFSGHCGLQAALAG
jgi:hypothetical protein